MSNAVAEQTGRVVVVEHITNQDDRAALQVHGTLISLSDTCTLRKPAAWKGREFYEWLINALCEIEYDSERDYVALTGNYLLLSSLIAAIAATETVPYRINVLAFSRGDNGEPRFKKTALEEKPN